MPPLSNDGNMINSNSLIIGLVVVVCVLRFVLTCC